MVFLSFVWVVPVFLTTPVKETRSTLDGYSSKGNRFGKFEILFYINENVWEGEGWSTLIILRLLSYTFKTL